MHAIMKKSFVFTAPFLFLVLGACGAYDLPTSTFVSVDKALLPSDYIDHWNTIPRFEIDLDVMGSLRPGDPIELAFSVRAMLQTAEVQVSIVAPEVEAAQATDWGGRLLGASTDTNI